MADFSIDKKIYVTHYDDCFRYVVYTGDDPVTITIEYQERKHIEGGKYCAVQKMEGLWRGKRRRAWASGDPTG